MYEYTKIKRLYSYTKYFQVVIIKKQLKFDKNDISKYNYSIFYICNKGMKKTNIQWKISKRFYNVKNRRIEKFVHNRIYTHHAIVHAWELFIIWIIGTFSLMYANYSNSYEHLHRTNTEEINKALISAINQEKPNTNEGKIISIREMDWNVNNTFAAWYCTYWAARISSEFFPYKNNWTEQERTWWWNAVDRCENANKAWFEIWTTPSIWSLIVYKWNYSNRNLWHVGRVMYYNKDKKSLVVRDMNRLELYVMTDRRDSSDNNNIKCFIYNKKIDSIWEDNTQNNDKFNIEKTTIPTNNNQTIINTDLNIPVVENKEINHNAANEEPIINNNEENIKNEQEKENNEFYNNLNTEIKETFIITPNEKFSDISNHFFEKNEVKITIKKKNILSINNIITLEITIINKETQEFYMWILPFIINTISQDNSLEWWLKTIQFIPEKENKIYFKAKKIWKTNLLLTIDDEEIKNIAIQIQ